MFGAYIIQDELLINHHQRSRGFVLMYSHVFMVIALLSMTAGLDYLAESEVSRMLIFLISAGISFYGMQSNFGLITGFALCGVSEFLWLLKISRIRK